MISLTVAVVSHWTGNGRLMDKLEGIGTSQLVTRLNEWRSVFNFMYVVSQKKIFLEKKASFTIFYTLSPSKCQYQEEIIDMKI